MSGFAIFVQEQGFMSSVGALADALALLRHQIAHVYQSRDHFSMSSELHLLSLTGEDIKMANGTLLKVDKSIKDTPNYDLIHLPGYLSGSEAVLLKKINSNTALYPWLRKQYEKGALVCASGSSVLTLAESSLLNGAKVSLPRQIMPLCTRRYPGLRINPYAPVTQHDRLITSNGFASDMLMVSRVIEHIMGPHLTRWLGDVTGLHTEPSGDQPEDPLVTNAQLWLEERFAEPINISDLAKAMLVSQQTLLRHFQSQLNMTPQSYLRYLRVENAKRLLLKTNRSVEQIAVLVGYNDVQSFRKVFRQLTGTSASQYRTECKTLQYE